MQKSSLLMPLLFTLQLTVFAAAPYNLEGIASLNVLVIDSGKTITPALKQKIENELKEKLEKSGIKSKKEGVGALFVKIDALKSANSTVVSISFGVGEDARIERAGTVDSFVLSYSNDDFFESEDVNADVYDSIVNYLMEEFIEQFREDNEE
ncbi:hypothetical protein [Sulfurimonas sp. HSL3-7]|uniref:hypothetical protein n=1 Tax=Sulfonitrofixus jiaomeiensis TaxID=3131938 RepID=UPI0031F927BA